MLWCFASWALLAVLLALAALIVHPLRLVALLHPVVLLRGCLALLCLLVALGLIGLGFAVARSDRPTVPAEWQGRPAPAR